MGGRENVAGRGEQALRHEILSCSLPRAERTILGKPVRVHDDTAQVSSSLRKPT